MDLHGRPGEERTCQVHSRGRLHEATDGSHLQVDRMQAKARTSHSSSILLITSVGNLSGNACCKPMLPFEGKASTATSSSRGTSYSKMSGRTGLWMGLVCVGRTVLPAHVTHFKKCCSRHRCRCTGVGTEWCLLYSFTYTARHSIDSPPQAALIPTNRPATSSTSSNVVDFHRPVTCVSGPAAHGYGVTRHPCRRP